MLATYNEMYVLLLINLGPYGDGVIYVLALEEVMFTFNNIGPLPVTTGHMPRLDRSSFGTTPTSDIG